MTDSSDRWALDADTAVDKQGEHRYSATVTPRWNALTGFANGGYLAALAVNAARQGLAQPDPLTVSTFFLRPGVPGPVDIDTEVIREGRRTATAQARVVAAGAPMVHTVATFGDLAATEGPTLELGAPPPLPPPEQCLDPLAALDFPDLTLLNQVDYRAARMPEFTEGRSDGDPQIECWLRLADGRPADPLALVMLVDAVPPAVVQQGHWSSTTVELTVHVRAHPAPGWLACRSTTRHLDRGLHEEDFEIWDAEGRLVAQSRQLALIV